MHTALRLRLRAPDSDGQPARNSPVAAAGVKRSGGPEEIVRPRCCPARGGRDRFARRRRCEHCCRFESHFPGEHHFRRDCLLRCARSGRRRPACRPPRLDRSSFPRRSRSPRQSGHRTPRTPSVRRRRWAEPVPAARPTPARSRDAGTSQPSPRRLLLLHSVFSLRPPSVVAVSGASPRQFRSTDARTEIPEHIGH